MYFSSRQKNGNTTNKYCFCYHWLRLFRLKQNIIIFTHKKKYLLLYLFKILYLFTCSNCKAVNNPLNKTNMYCTVYLLEINDYVKSISVSQAQRSIKVYTSICSKWWFWFLHSWILRVERFFPQFLKLNPLFPVAWRERYSIHKNRSR